ncbi:MAG: right-handed parallel beta-helix repeat-containing protein [Chthoniobacterales bacterium]
MTIKYVEIRSQPDEGISVGSWESTNPGWNFLNITHTHLHNNGSGMKTYGYTMQGVSTYAIGSITVSYSEFDHNESSGLVICGASEGAVTACSFHHNRSTGGCWTWGTSGIVIDHCISHDNLKGDAPDGFGFDLDGGSQNCTIQYCLSYRNETPGFVIFDYPQSANTANNVIRYCISENDVRLDKEWGSFEIFPWGDTPIKNCHIYNCVAYLTSRAGKTSISGFEAYGQQTKSGYYYSGKTTGCSFRNNVIYLDKPGSDMRFLTCNPGATQLTQVAIQNNIYYSSEHESSIYFLDRLYTKFEDWKSSFPYQESLNGTRLERVMDPCFSSLGGGCEIIDPQGINSINSYRPAFFSPCHNNGLELNRLFGIDQGSFDFSDNTLPSNGPFSIGAFQ